ncbi:putative mitochondrial carrier TC2A29 family protein [Teratosphaeria destructans]|uniref:Mitochondrial carrier TC2A29 family protein n=1 Tax=Teratosphaeria destructans TaxID=418781 RepID=A0A9W7W1S0_9PEZI|nr:putative mitochondrial carrier TC2A29 family protein [Teratosphaeria destructans]
MAAVDTQGQRHNRISPRHGENDAPSRAAARDAPGDGISVTQRMLSAVTGSILTSLLVTPLDVVRVRLQAQKSPSPSANLPSFLHLPPNLGVKESQRRTFNSTVDGIRKIARNEGIWTLWRGLTPTLAMAIPGNVIYFAGYDWLRSSPRSPMVGRVTDEYQPLVGGSVARVLAAICVSPIEMLRTRMQAAQAGEKGVLSETVGGLKDMVGVEGYSSLWRGLTLTLWRDVPFSALYWWGYEFGRSRLDETRARTTFLAGRDHRAELSHSALLVDSFIAGAASGGIASFVTTPFDVGKTRRQTFMHDAKDKVKDAPEGRSMPRFLWHIYRTEGTAGLFKGWSARCLKVAPACAIMISSYEIGKKLAVDVAQERGDEP